MSTFYNKKDGTLEPISTNTQIIDQPANHFLSKEAYDPDGVVAEAGGIEEYVDDHMGVATPIDAVRNNNIDSNLEELSYKHDTQAYIRLYVDDARNDLPDVWAIFQEYGVVANIAVPTNTLENTANNGQKIKDLLHDMEDAGCEIQSHGIDFNPLTANSTREDAIVMLKDSKEALLKEGYKVYGFCRPGGTNEVKFGTKGFGDLVQQYYLYSDDDTIAPSRINDVRAAIGLNVTEANIRSIVNATKSKFPARKILIHGIGTDITEANLRYLITYAQSENIQFITDYEYYHNHVIAISDDRLQKIENGDLTPYTTFDHFFFEQCYGRVNYDHSQYPYGLIYSTGLHQLFISDSPVILDTTSSTGKYRRENNESFKYQRWEYANCQWTLIQSGSTASYNTLVSGTPLFANFEVVNDSGTVLVDVTNYYNYVGTYPKMTIPTGGTTAQILVKKSNSNYDVEWKDASGGGMPQIEGVEPIKVYTPIEVTYTENQYIKRQNGAIVNDNGRAWFEVSVTEGERYRIISNHYANIATCVLYDENGGYMSGYPTEAIPHFVVDATDITIPQGAVTMRCSGSHGSADALLLYKVTDSGSYIVNNKNDKLFGKKWVACGDSFTFGAFGSYTDSQGNLGQHSDAFDQIEGMWKTYPYFVKKLTGINTKVLAQGGNDFTNLSGAVRPFSNSTGNYINYTEIPSDADYITFQFGLNESDMTSEQIGTKTDTTNATLWGAYNVVLESILTANPTVKIGIIISDAWMTQTYHDALIEIAKYWGIPYLDLKNGDEVPMMIGGELREHSTIASTLRNGAFQMASGNAHPNVIGHEYRSTVIENFLRSL